MNPHLRQEKNCLNCGAHVEERYCSHCGQENVEIKESFRHLVAHFFEDLTHYDSKLFTTVKDLLFRPGFLTKEYLEGRRTTYLHPVRMYVFVSFLYFLTILSFSNLESKTDEAIVDKASQDTRKQIADSLQLMLSAGNHKLETVQKKDSVIKEVLKKIKADSLKTGDMIYMFNVHYSDLVAYDSAQKRLPENLKDRGFKSWLYHRWLNTYNLYGKRGVILLAVSRTNHFVPKMMFILLPFFALLLRLFYDRKKYFYVDHIIFSIHFHTAVFVIFLVFAVIGHFFTALTKDASTLSYCLALIYLGIALKKVYGQSVVVTILKELGVALLYAIFILAGYVTLIISSLI